MYEFASNMHTHNSPFLSASDFHPFTPEESGTSLIALKFKDGVVVGSESRSSAGQIIASRGSRKIGVVHYRIAIASSGRSADNQTLQQIVKAQLKQNSQELNSPGGVFQPQADIPLHLPTVHTAAHIYKTLSFNYKNQLGSSSIVAGWHPQTGPKIYSVPRGGLMIDRDFAADGSGSIFMLSFLDENYSPDLTKEQCVELAKMALKMAIERDASSGGIMDIVVITAESVQQTRLDSTQYNYNS